MSEQFPAPLGTDEEWSVEVQTEAPTGYYSSGEATFDTKENAIKAWHDNQPAILKCTRTSFWIQGDLAERYKAMKEAEAAS